MLKLTLIFLLQFNFSNYSHAEMSPCAKKMYSHLVNLDRENEDKKYWASAAATALGICTKCDGLRKRLLCARYVSSVNKKTTNHQIGRMLNLIEHDESTVNKTNLLIIDGEDQIYKPNQTGIGI